MRNNDQIFWHTYSISIIIDELLNKPPALKLTAATLLVYGRNYLQLFALGLPTHPTA